MASQAVQKLKSVLAKIAGASGCTSLVRQVRSAVAAPHRAFVLFYHRVSPRPSLFGLTVTPECFDEQISLLTRRTKMVTLSELVLRLQNPAPLSEDWAAVTFDDGYRDNLEVAAPILRRHGVPATIFVTTGFVDGTEVPFWDRLETAFLRARRNGTTGRWRDLGLGELDTAIGTALEESDDEWRVRDLNEVMSRSVPELRAKVLDQLEAITGSGGKVGDLMLGWKEVRELADVGLEIGAHTMSHPRCSLLSPSDAEAELLGSVETIETRIGRPVAGVAFPYGDCSADNVSLVRNSGLRYACTTLRGTNFPGCDPFLLRRISSPQGDDIQSLDLKLALGGPFWISEWPAWVDAQ